MPLQNRALPTGEIAALPFRGLFMGNRGQLHDENCVIVRDWTWSFWIICETHRVLKSTGEPVHRTLMAPNRYTELFFLDEPSALAAGHRPCHDCRNASAKAFGRAAGIARAGDLDAALMSERRTGAKGDRKCSRVPRRHEARAADLPFGSMVIEGATVFARHQRGFLAWSHDRAATSSAGSDGYLATLEPVREDADELRRRLDRDAALTVLTPPTTRLALANGYVPRWHQTAETAAAIEAPAIPAAWGHPTSADRTAGGSSRRN